MKKTWVGFFCVCRLLAQTTSGQDVQVDVRAKTFTIAKSVSITPTVGAAFNSNFVFINPAPEKPGMCVYVTNDKGNTGGSHTVGLAVFLTNNETPLPVKADGTNEWRNAPVWNGATILGSGTATIAVQQTMAFFVETQGSLFIALSPSTSGSNDKFSVEGSMVDAGSCGTTLQTGGPTNTHAPSVLVGSLRASNPSSGSLDPLTSSPCTATSSNCNSQPVLFVQPTAYPTAALMATTLLPTGANGIALVEKGPRWSLASNTGSGVQATVTKAAGGAGVRHIVDCLTYSWASVSATQAGTGTLLLRDGTTGTGTVLFEMYTQIPVAGGVVAPFGICGLGILGSANTAITWEWLGLIASVSQAVNMTGYDVQ